MNVYPAKVVNHKARISFCPHVVGISTHRTILLAWPAAMPSHPYAAPRSAGAREQRGAAPVAVYFQNYNLSKQHPLGERLQSIAVPVLARAVLRAKAGLPLGQIDRSNRQQHIRAFAGRPRHVDVAAACTLQAA